jgi:hypothetical protein
LPGLTVNSSPGSPSSPIALQMFLSFSLVLILQAKWQSQDVNPECLGGVATGDRCTKKYQSYGRVLKMDPQVTVGFNTKMV